MSTEATTSDSNRGYRSAASKQRFTIVAGVLGAVFFLAQMVLPMVLVLAIMFPMMMRQELKSTDLSGAALWNDQIWYVEQASKINYGDPAASPSTLWLRHLGSADLVEAKAAVRLERFEQPGKARKDSPDLLLQGDRLWLIGAERVGYLEQGSVTDLGALHRPARASAPFVHRERPALVTHGRSPSLVTLELRGGTAEWRSESLELDLPACGSLRALEVVTAGGQGHLIANLCGEEGEDCALHARAFDGGEWRRLAGDVTRATWRGVALGDQAAIVIAEDTGERDRRFSLLTLGAGSQPRELPAAGGRFGWNWQAFTSEGSLLLVTEGMPGSRTLVEVADGKAVRTVVRKGSFPFGNGMVAMMTVPNVLPVLLSLLLALLLTMEMGKHRVEAYAVNGVERRFASLWRRAWAQVVDAVPLGAGFAGTMWWFWWVFSDPERMLEGWGPYFPLVFLASFALSFVWMVLVLVVYSYFEGRTGKTPGKWLLRIRVLGADLTPCGFWRALVRNLMTFVDGTFNFLIGLLLAALTEHWQRLGDLAARTIVVVDDPRAGGAGATTE